VVLSLQEAVRRKVRYRESTLDLLKEGKVTRHEAAIAGIADLDIIRICRLLSSHPFWIAQSLYCKMIKHYYRQEKVGQN
jgi:hypothetical protein